MGNHAEALKVLESFRNVVKEDELKNYEKSELILYEVTILLEMENYKEALKHLEKKEKYYFKFAPRPNIIGILLTKLLSMSMPLKLIWH